MLGDNGEWISDFVQKTCYPFVERGEYTVYSRIEKP